MGLLTTSYERWQREPFPPGHPDDAIDELHADLALADSWVADSVTPFVERGMHEPARIDVISELHELRGRATDLEASVASDDRALVRDYAAYLDALLVVYQDFLDSAPPSS